MKICSSCGAKYSEWIDFCFEDGSVLAVQQASAESETSAIDLPMPRHLRAQDAQEVPEAPAAKSGRRRSLISGAAREAHAVDVPRGRDPEPILDVPPPPVADAPPPPVRTAPQAGQIFILLYFFFFIYFS